MILKIKFYILLLACICLGFGSCTKDYLRSETNVIFFVPQLASGELNGITLLLHGADGELLYRRAFLADGTAHEPGLLRLSVPGVKSLQGSDAVVTCISDSNRGEISQDADFYLTKITSTPDESNPNRHLLSSDYRFFNHPTRIFPLGIYPRIDTLDVTKEYLHKGRVNLTFKMMPSEIVGANIRYYNLGTSLGFNGFYGGSPGHYKETKIDFPSNGSVQDHTSTSIVNGSVGERVSHIIQPDFLDNRSSTVTRSKNSFDLEVEFLGKGGYITGTYRLSEALLGEDSDGDGVADGVPSVTTPDGPQDASNLFLESKGELSFEFKGMRLTGISLEGWGDLIDGETTPM